MLALKPSGPALLRPLNYDFISYISSVETSIFVWIDLGFTLKALITKLVY